MTSTTITVLVDNHAKTPELGVEHGLSMWIEVDGQNILFDAGQTGLLQHNAETLGMDLGKADLVVISHGHYDHTGGLPVVPGLLNQSLPVWCHPGAFRLRYSHSRPGDARMIGIPKEVRELLRHSDCQLHEVTTPVQLTEHAWITGEIPRTTEFEDTGGPFTLDPQGKTPDLIEDDQALWIELSAGRVVVLGCAHAGVVNTLRYIEQVAGERPLLAVMGGTHLVNAGPERMQATLEAFQTASPQQLAPGHCTGDRAIQQIKQQFPEQYREFSAGTKFVWA